jgi:SAM-dependent methyltransferase
MGFYSDHILPRCIDFALSRPRILTLRERVSAGLSGRVLEIGVGSGLNLPYYPAGVSELVALEPSLTARKLAQPRVGAARFPITWLELNGPTLQLPAASVDCVLSTFTLCTIPDVQAALRELKRVLRPCGKLFFLEHGRSPNPGVARWQDRLTPINKLVGGGCHLNRPIADLLRDAGFCLDALQTYYIDGPKLGSFLYEGVACACNQSAAQA